MKLKTALVVIILVAVIGFIPSPRLCIPVAGATTADWNHHTFWYYPWGRSGVHKGIDIFAEVGRPVVAASPGLVVYTDVLSLGGNVIAILGPKWRLHYYAHLDTRLVGIGSIVSRGDTIATVGTTGNAQGTTPHLHYSILTIVPYPWRWTNEQQGWKKMFFLNPHELLTE